MVDLGGYVIIIVETKDKKIKLYGSPADKADLEVGDEILEVNGRSLEDATHTEVISHIHQCIRSRTICLRVKRRSGNKLALDLASQSNVQDAFVIAVEQQARERLEKLSALKRIKPVDMTKLSHQLSEVPSGGDTSELNGLIEAATGSPIYVTSASELSSSSQSALHRTAAGSTTGGGGGGGDNISDRSPLRSVDGNNVTVVGVNSTSSSSNHHLLPATTSTTAAEGDDDEENVLTTRAQVRKALPNGQYPDTARKSSSRDSINSSGKTSGGSRESIDVEGAKSSSSRGRGGKLNSSRESVADPAQYANMINMVEWDNNGPHREMAVDVPESFVPRNKTPPRYPPNKASTLNASNNNNKPALTKTVSSGGGVAVMSSDGVGVRGNGTLTGQNGATKPVPPPRIGDNKETGSWSSVNNNNTQIPYVHPRTIVSPSKTGTAIAATTPSRDEAERIRKYQEELKKRREQEEQHAKEQEFLRTSIRGSKKLQALESGREESPVSGFVNDAYDDVDEDRIPYPHPRFDASTSLQKPVGLTDLVASLHRVQQTLKKNGLHLDETVSAVGTLMQTPEFQQILAVHNKVQDVWCFNAPPTPFSAHAHQLVQEVSGSLYNCSVPESVELTEILSRVDLEGVLYSHDKIAERERLLMTNDSATGESVDADPVVISSSIIPVVPQTSLINPPKPSVRPFVSEPQPDDRIKVVRIEKTQDPLGATVRNQCLHGSNDLDAVVIGRIVKGGAAERSGLLHEGDEILEVNGLEMRGKGVNEVCEILSRLTGTLTFLIVPTQSPPTIQQRRDVLIHVRAHFDYDPEDDQYLPCRELGIAFSKGDVLHVINQDDPSWWQAHREGEEDQALAGLIPSKSFQEQRCTLQQQLLGETETREKSRKGTLLCAKSQKKKKKKIPYSSAFNDDFDAEEIPTYEEVSLYYPRTSFKRPVVLIGPPNIGRHELRQRLMQESERFAAAVPHTSRTKKDGEIDGQDYHFISRAQFESDILGRKFVEHGEFEKAYYGTSLDAIRSVVNLGKICVLNLHPQSLKMLRNSDLRPYIVFVAPPPLERLKQMRIARGEAYKEEELIDIIEKAREMDEKYGHYFDLVIINNEIERTYHELLQRINYTEREPQWVPAFWEVKVGS
ncbi:MAGUK p55 subfamily member 5 isoform X5 [Folsomia candida]|uniref:MAGUK p55 subfamily member 5 isoform X5 n=1 Tax=Folsomia candida TaxID=158441 RepID=UPI001604D02E|nr:MAGUK p55 subfamily member 5 isoform X5 [Folsomia candida]